MNSVKKVAIYPPFAGGAPAGRAFVGSRVAGVNERALQFTQGCWSTAPRLGGVT